MPCLRSMRAPWLTALALLACAAPCPIAGAQEPREQRVDVIRNGVTTSLVLPIYRSQGITYASLSDVARQLEGAVEVDGARAVLRLGGDSAEAGLESAEARAADKTITLRHPVRAYHEDALVSFDDLVPLLREGFGFGTPDAPPAGSALRLNPEDVPLDSIDSPNTPPPADLEEHAPLESIELMEETAFESVAAGNPVVEAHPLSEPIVGGPDFLLAIDPGHGGDDTGAVGPNGLAEKDLCLAVADSLRRILKEQYGIATVATRDKDETQSLQSRIHQLEENKAGLIVSIHGGASYAVQVSGPALFAHRPAQRLSTDPRPSLQAAQVLANAFAGVAGPEIPLVHEVPLGLLRQSKAPGILIELGNLTNPEEAARLADVAYQSALAAALADGLNRLLEPSAPEGGNP